MQRNGAPADGRNKWVSLGFRHTLYNWSYGYLWTGRGRSCGCERKTKICLSQNITNPVQKNINVLKYLKKRQWFLGNLIPLSGQIMRIYIYIMFVLLLYQVYIRGKKPTKKLSDLQLGQLSPSSQPNHKTQRPQRQLMMTGHPILSP